MITFFGASVTLQKNGYASKLEKMLKDDVKIFGYGGMHIKNAGICYIDDIIKYNPSYCFVDFFSTVYTEENENTIEYLDTIVYKFSKINCKLIFLFFPRKYDKLDEWYSYCKNYLKEKNLFYIDIRDKLNTYTESQFLKDYVHTNNFGSKLYANIIFEEFQSKKSTIKIPNKTMKTNYTDIKVLKINKEFNNKLSIEGSGKIIGILNTIGPFSGLVNISIDNSSYYKEKIWDEWCHYTRKHFNLILDFKKNIEIEILEDDFDTSINKDNLNFHKFTKKLIIHEIYYIGNDLKISNISDGKNINKLQLLYLNLRARLKQYAKKLKR